VVQGQIERKSDTIRPTAMSSGSRAACRRYSPPGDMHTIDSYPGQFCEKLSCRARLEGRNVAKDVIGSTFGHQLLGGFVVEHWQRFVSIPEQRLRDVA